MSATQKAGYYKANAVAKRFKAILTQLKALAQQSINKYKHYANLCYKDAPKYKVGQLVWLDARNLKTARPIKKGEEKVIGLFKISKTYLRACLLELPLEIKIFLVFYYSLLRPHSNSAGLLGQDKINKAELRKLRGRTYERTDGTVDTEPRWEFEGILDCHKNRSGLNY